MRVEQLSILLILREQRAREHVAQQEHDPEHLVRLDAAGDDSLGELAGVGLQGFDAARLERIDVVVVDLGRFGEDLLVGHHAQELGLADAPRPLLAELRAVVTQVGHQFLQQWAGLLGALGPPARRSPCRAPRPLPAGRALAPSAPPRIWDWPRRAGVPKWWADARSCRARAARAGPVEKEGGDGRDLVLLAERRVGQEHAYDQADERLGQASACRCRRGCLRRPAHARTVGAVAGSACARTARDRIALRWRAKSTKESPTSTRARTARTTPSSGSTSLILADARRASASLTAARASSSNQSLAVGEVAVDGGPGDSCCGGDVVHARLLALHRERPRRAIEDRRGHSLLQRLSWGWFGHRRLVRTLKVRLTRRHCLI